MSRSHPGVSISRRAWEKVLAHCEVTGEKPGTFIGAMIEERLDRLESQGQRAAAARQPAVEVTISGRTPYPHPGTLPRTFDPARRA